MNWTEDKIAKLRALLAEVRPDVAHLHCISRQISPSILPALKEASAVLALETELTTIWQPYVKPLPPEPPPATETHEDTK